MSEPGQFFEAKRRMDPSSYDTRYYNALMDMAGALAKIFRRYSRATRKEAWRSIISNKGKKEVNRLLLDPDIPITRFRRIGRGFKEWLDSQPQPFPKIYRNLKV